MAIKAIQLRGISRTPSDRMTADGGLAESLNVFLDEDETAPMPMPEDVTETATDGDGKKLFPSADVEGNPTDWEAVFIHKSPYFTRAIVKYTEEVQPEEEESEEPTQPSSGTSGYEVGEEQDPWEVDDSENWGDSNEPVESGGSQSQEESDESETSTTASTVTVTKLGWVNDGVVFEIMTLDEDERFIRCTSIGNTLGIVTSEVVMWFLTKDGEYKKLGSKIPFPNFTVSGIPAAKDRIQCLSVGSGIGNSKAVSEDPLLTPPYSIQELLTFRDAMDTFYGNPNRGLGEKIFLYPRFVIVAVKLYDGSRICSTPILVGMPDASIYVRVVYWQTEQGYVCLPEVCPSYPYTIKFDFEESSDFFEDWKDIVSSVEIYLSDEAKPDENDFITPLITTPSPENYNWTYAIRYLFRIKKNYVERTLLSKSQFYLVKSYDIQDDPSSKIEILDPYYITKDNIGVLAEKEALDTSAIGATNDIKFTNSTLYNNSLVTFGVSSRVAFSAKNLISQIKVSQDWIRGDGYSYRGPENIMDNHGLNYYSDMYPLNHDFLLQPRYRFQVKKIVFKLVNSADGNTRFLSAKQDDSSVVEYDGYSTVQIDDDYRLWHGGSSQDQGDYSLSNVPYDLLFCPDTRARRAEITLSYNDNGTIREKVIAFDMKPDPWLNCSYGYGSLGFAGDEFAVSALSAYNQASVIESQGKDVSDSIDYLPNKVYISERDNPFVFPIAGRQTFSSKVLGVAIATTALSTGQFGQYPLYVFTDDGIWAMETGAAGDFVTSKPVSRDVCINPESITSIDNAVVFVTEKGVMVISGSQIQCISENMNGQHFHLERSSEEYNLIAGSDWASLLDDITTDDTHFMAFMKEAFITYDYTGARLVFFKPDEKYQYVYYLKTATWHKTYVDCGLADTESGGRPRFDYPLSDYPETYVNALCESEQNPGYRILKMSTRKDVAATGRVRGMIVTRPIEFGLADVRKVIKDIRIRGVYEKSEGKGAFYILLGSYDGLHWSVLRSLRGGSYKLFRMIILTNLAPNERISWIDADFEERYNNKLR